MAHKDHFNSPLVEQMAAIIQRSEPRFDAKSFATVADQLDVLELKARVDAICDALDQALPNGLDALEALIPSILHPSQDPEQNDQPDVKLGLLGWAIWPLADLVTRRGLGHPERALNLLKECTKRWTAEFAIRPFLIEHQDLTLSFLKDWTQDENRHVRRLCSEGSRPRLPWGMQLPAFILDPHLTMPLLADLRFDDDEYVRRSVANHINDISKDHPDLVSSIAADWLVGADRDQIRMVRHACRTLLKQGHGGVLNAFGYECSNSVEASLRIANQTVSLGEALSFDLAMTGLPANSPIMVDYAIHFLRGRGEMTPKIFKWKDTRAGSDGVFQAERRHVIKPVTVRRYYAGPQMLEIFVNGQSVARESFTLTIDCALDLRGL